MRATPPLPKPRLWTSVFSAERLWQKLAPAMSGSLGRTLDEFFEVHLLHPGQTADVAGLNRISRKIFSNAAGAICGMLGLGGDDTSPEEYNEFAGFFHARIEEFALSLMAEATAPGTN